MERWIKLLGKLKASGLRIAGRQIVLGRNKMAGPAPPSVEQRPQRVSLACSQPSQSTSDLQCPLQESEVFSGPISPKLCLARKLTWLVTVGLSPGERQTSICKTVDILVGGAKT